MNNHIFHIFIHNSGFIIILLVTFKWVKWICSFYSKRSPNLLIIQNGQFTLPHMFMFVHVLFLGLWLIDDDQLFIKYKLCIISLLCSAANELSSRYTKGRFLNSVSKSPRRSSVGGFGEVLWCDPVWDGRFGAGAGREGFIRTLGVRWGTFDVLFVWGTTGFAKIWDDIESGCPQLSATRDDPWAAWTKLFSTGRDIKLSFRFWKVSESISIILLKSFYFRWVLSKYELPYFVHQIRHPFLWCWII